MCVLDESVAVPRPCPLWVMGNMPALLNVDDNLYIHIPENQSAVDSRIQKNSRIKSLEIAT